MLHDADTDTVREAPTTELLRCAAAGDAPAWAELLRRYRPVVRARMRSYDLQEADRLDVEQTAWLRLAENIHRLRTPEHLGGWLATVVGHESLRVRKALTRTVVGGDQLGATLADPGVGPEQSAVDDDVARRLWQAVDRLPPARRRLVRALFGDGTASYGEISRMTGTPVGGIGPTRGRAMRQLRGLLATDECGEGTGGNPTGRRHQRAG